MRRGVSLWKSVHQSRVHGHAPGRGHPQCHAVIIHENLLEREDRSRLQPPASATAGMHRAEAALSVMPLSYMRISLSKITDVIHENFLELEDRSRLRPPASGSPACTGPRPPSVTCRDHT